MKHDDRWYDDGGWRKPRETTSYRNRTIPLCVLESNKFFWEERAWSLGGFLGDSADKSSRFKMFLITFSCDLVLSGSVNETEHETIFEWEDRRIFWVGETSIIFVNEFLINNLFSNEK